MAGPVPGTAGAQALSDGSPCVWTGAVTWRNVAKLREQLFDEIDTRTGGLTLDVRAVVEIDRTGVALLIGARHRGQSLGRPLTLIDNAGAVTEALTKSHVIADFAVRGDAEDVEAGLRSAAAAGVRRPPTSSSRIPEQGSGELGCPAFQIDPGEKEPS